MKKISIFPVFLLIVIISGCWNNDVVGPDDGHDKVIITEGGAKKPIEEPKKEEPKNHSAEQPPPVIVNVNINNNNNNGSGTQVVDQKGADVDSNNTNTTPKEEPKVEPKEPDKPVVKPEEPKEPEKPAEKPKEPPEQEKKPEEKPVAKPELSWSHSISGDKITATLSMKNPGDTRWAKIYLDFDFSLVRLDVVDPSLSWKADGTADLAAANKNGQLKLVLENQGGAENKMCSFTFAILGKGKSLIGLSGYTAFFRTQEDMKAGRNKVIISFPTPIEVIRE